MPHTHSELIEAKMAATRHSLTEKVSALEDSVVETMQSATSAVRDTVQSIRCAVEGTVDMVRNQLNYVLDVRGHVRDHPWGMVAGASVAGFLAGRVLGAGSRNDAGPPVARSIAASNGVPRRMTGLWDSFLDRLGEEMKKVGESAIQCVSGHLDRMVKTGFQGGIVGSAGFGGEPTDDLPSSHPIGRWNGMSSRETAPDRH